ncbi:MAG: hypothetical protein ABI967_06800 [bacterium]
MTLKQRRGLKALALFLVFALAQVYVQMGWALPVPGNPLPAPQQFIARLTTRGNVPVLVNGNSATTGASIVTGAIIETLADQSATINIGDTIVDLAPNTKIRLDYDENGKAKIFLISGCAVARSKRNADAEIETGDQVSQGTTKKSKGGVIDVCFIGGKAVVNQGSAAAAGAGAGPGPVATTAAATGGGLSTGTIVLIAVVAGGGIAAAIAIASGDDNTIQTNPSPSAPSTQGGG